ncbi:MAG: hypothetical protein H8D74_01260 [Chloroflexi bacterium]|nr:hypothetical protein [Chloroflexota bacterium]
MSNSPRRIFNTWDDEGMPAGATSLYGVVQADGAFTYTSFNDLGISITVEQF